MNIHSKPTKEELLQKNYYAKTADHYETMHVSDHDEHQFSLCVMSGLINYMQIKSVLDIGSGTGRALLWLKKNHPDLSITGIEPVDELREVGYSKGLSRDELIPGDALNLAFDNCAFDLVCEFGVLHHIRKPNLVVDEMLRVASKAIFISDCNNFGIGSPVSRHLKQLINSVGLWPLADLIKTKGKGYTISEGDGLAYSYSVFNNYRQIKSRCKSVHTINSAPSGINHYRTSTHVALLGIK